MINYTLLIFVFIGFCIFMLFRNNWIYKIRTAHCDLVHELMEKKIKDGSYSVTLNRQYHDCVWEYNKMLNHFWIWDISKMITDRVKFDELMEFKKGRDNESEMDKGLAH